METMAEPNPPEPAETDPIPMSEMFHVIGNQADDVVYTALQHRHAASTAARSALNAAIDRTPIAFDGFRKPSRAQPDMLAAPLLLELLGGNDRLASAVLRMWAEALPDLAELITTHLAAVSIPVAPPKKHTFDAVWPHSLCFLQSGMLVAEHPAFNRHDAALMLCYLSGRFPIEERIESYLFERFLEELDALPFDAPEWDETYNFITQLTTTVAAKVGERKLAQQQEFHDAIASVTSEFADELRYLDIDLTAVSSGAVDHALIRSALIFAGDLRSALEAYREVRPQAPTRNEEMERAEQRDACEARILAVVDVWHEAIKIASERDAADDEAGGERDALHGATPRQSEGAEGAKEELAAENTRLKWANDALREDRAALQAENARLTRELASLRHAHDNLRAEKEAQGEENSTLRRQLRESRLREEAWRGAPVAVHPTSEEPPQPPVESVRDAIAAAEAGFPGKLVIALNSRSRDDTPFRRPGEVFDALAWLATAYHRARTDSNGDTPDFDTMLKEVCPGWSYVPHQSAVTVGMFKDWYYASVNGNRYELAEHLGRGSSGNPQHTIRIAFAWDDHDKRVVVGYVGHHQRNQGS